MMMKMIDLTSRSVVIIGVAAAVGTIAGCVRRTLTIETEPQGAMVYLNDEAVGPSPVSRDFTWYGDYGVIMRKDGFETLHTNVVVAAPWYQIPPIDFVADVLWPVTIHDVHRHSFTLQPRVEPSHDDVVSQALKLRDEAVADHQ